MNQNTRQRGFSLIELLIVVGIIGIISAIAVPSLLSARTAARHGAALANLQTMLKSEYALRISTGRFGRMSEVNQYYGGTLGQMTGESLSRQNYVYTMPSSPTDAQLKDAFSILATGPGLDGLTPFIFTLDESGVIHQLSP